MGSILPVGCATKGNYDGVLPPGYQALGAGQGVSDQLQMLQVIQLHGCLFARCQQA